MLARTFSAFIVERAGDAGWNTSVLVERAYPGLCYSIGWMQSCSSSPSPLGRGARSAG